eukprot:TRINITY_DN2726_c0_g1_i1.p1 TRINITY_DN2726_c0_g1~~TRINITY_DN2726_c0_g1_i1.p1  ORF type:complete len:301 (+),score=60.48 TRINITY_DN2726_c0_g1_i1:203-1105(+)
MTFKERTSEFNSIVQNAKQRKDSIPSAIGIARSKPRKNEKTQFFIIATQIGKDMGETAEKLDRLSKLAKKRTLFDDPTIEIQELTQIINQDIKNLNNQINQLQQRKLAKNGKQVQAHSDTILDSLKNQLKHTTKDFSEVLEQRTETLKSQQKDKDIFTGSHSPALSNRRTAESPLYKQYDNRSYAGDSSSNNGEIVIAMPQMALATQERYISSRTEAVQSIERTIGELQGIFQQLAHLVAEQGELIERIDSNVDATTIHTERAQTALLKYMSSVSSNRWLIIKMFIALVFFVVLFVVFFV